MSERARERESKRESKRARASKTERRHRRAERRYSIVHVRENDGDRSSVSIFAWFRELECKLVRRLDIFEPTAKLTAERATYSLLFRIIELARSRHTHPTPNPMRENLVVPVCRDPAVPVVVRVVSQHVYS